MEIDTLLVAKVLDQADADFNPLGIIRANHAHPANWWQPHEQSRACTCEHCRLYVRLLDERRASEGQPPMPTCEGHKNRGFQYYCIDCSDALQAAQSPPERTECPPSSLKDLL